MLLAYLIEIKSRQKLFVEEINRCLPTDYILQVGNLLKSMGKDSLSVENTSSPVR